MPPRCDEPEQRPWGALMARPRTPIGTHGSINVTEVKPGLWRARARFRFDDGSIRQIERFAHNKTRALTSLQLAMTEVADHIGSDISRGTRLSQLAEMFLESKANLAPRSVDTYRQAIQHLIKPRIGQLSVGEATPDRLQRFFTELIRVNGPGAAKSCRSVVSGMMGLAVRSGAIRVNPVREIERIPRPGKGSVAVPVAELPELLSSIAKNERLQHLDIADLLIFMAGTGCRISEACALQWSDLDLNTGSVTFSRNVVRARGRGLVLQDHTKTTSGDRTVRIPQTLLDLLSRRSGAPTSVQFVFPTNQGNLRDPRNTSRAWLEERESLGYPDISSHSFRKTIATLMDGEGLSARDIAEYIGHKNPSLTQDVYMSKKAGGSRAADAIEKRFGRNAVESAGFVRGTMSETSINTEKEQYLTSNGWGGRDLNPRPRDYESLALTS
jgi:integrase